MGETSPSRPNFLILVSDEHSPHMAGCYGSSVIQTPALDRLAAEGVLFENAYCPSPLCMPSRSAFLSGRRPSQVGVWNNTSETPTHLPSIPRALGASGYHTAAFGKMHFSGRDQFWGFDERPYGDFGGMSHQPDPIRMAPRLTFVADAGPAEIPEDKMQETIVNRLGGEFLRSYRRAEPFCLWLSYNRPHFPVCPPQRYFDRYFPAHADLPEIPPGHLEAQHPWMQYHRWFFRSEQLTEAQIRRARAAYYGCVSFVDTKVGEILSVLDETGLTENTVVVYLSDHGEMLGEHGQWRKCSPYDASVRVPFLFRWRRHFAERIRIKDPVELLDLFPTLSELAGVVVPAGVEGQSLVSTLTGSRSGSLKGYAISEYTSHGVPGPFRTVHAGDWKYIYYLDAKPSVFNLREDPNEYSDRSDDPGVRAVARELEHLVLENWNLDEVRRHAYHTDTPGIIQSHYLDRAPNQFRRADGTLIDAEDFYPAVPWAEGVGRATP